MKKKITASFTVLSQLQLTKIQSRCLFCKKQQQEGELQSLSMKAPEEEDVFEGKGTARLAGRVWTNLVSY